MLLCAPLSSGPRAAACIQQRLQRVGRLRCDTNRACLPGRARIEVFHALLPLLRCSLHPCRILCRAQGSLQHGGPPGLVLLHACLGEAPQHPSSLQITEGVNRQGVLAEKYYV